MERTVDRGSAEGRERVGSEVIRGDVSMTVGNPPSKRDHELGSLSQGMWGGRAVS